MLQLLTVVVIVPKSVMALCIGYIICWIVEDTTVKHVSYEYMSCKQHQYNLGATLWSQLILHKQADQSESLW